MTSDLLKPYPIQFEIPVVWGDMDAYQHVNNLAYLRYFESARVLYFDEAGVSAYMSQASIGPILHSTYCRYRIPLTYPDTIVATARVDFQKMEEDRFVMYHAVYSRQHKKFAAEGEGTIVFVDYKTGKKAAIPDQIRRNVEALEQRQR